MNTKHILFIILLPLLGLHAQQDAQYTQYMYNTMSVNPAYAGSREVISVTAIHRNQWVGIDGAPVSQSLNLHAPVGAANKVGLGLSIINDKIGPSQETLADLNFSYTLKTSEKNRLALGIKAGVHLLDVNFDRLDQFHTSDLLLDVNIDNKLSPTIGIGMYYYTPSFYMGLSAPNILETKHFDETSLGNTASSFLATERVTIYYIMGYVFGINKNLKLKPSLLTKAVAGAPVQFDISTNLLIRDKFTLGLAYRLSAALSAQAGFQFSRGILLGFAYDWETTSLGNTEFNAGTYEFFLRLEIFKKQDSILYPRFF